MLRLVVYPIIYRFWDTSQVVGFELGFLNHQQNSYTWVMATIATVMSYDGDNFVATCPFHQKMALKPVQGCQNPVNIQQIFWFFVWKEPTNQNKRSTFRPLVFLYFFPGLKSYQFYQLQRSIFSTKNSAAQHRFSFALFANGAHHWNPGKATGVEEVYQPLKPKLLHIP